MISDAALEAMLARRAHRADPDGLRDEVFALIDAVEPRRSWLGWRTGSLLGRWSVRQVALVAAAAGPAAGGVAGALIGARLIDTTPRTPLVADRHRRPDLRTGLVHRTSSPTATGIAWLREDTGAIVRFDPVTGSRRSWSVADDAAFAASADHPGARRWGLAGRAPNAVVVRRRGLPRRDRVAGGPRGGVRRGSRGGHRGARRQPLGGDLGWDRAALGRLLVEQARRPAGGHRGVRATRRELLPERDRGRRGRTRLDRLERVPDPAQRGLGLALRRLGVGRLRRWDDGQPGRVDCPAARWFDLGDH